MHIKTTCTRIAHSTQRFPLACTHSATSIPSARCDAHVFVYIFQTYLEHIHFASLWMRHHHIAACRRLWYLWRQEHCGYGKQRQAMGWKWSVEDGLSRVSTLCVWVCACVRVCVWRAWLTSLISYFFQRKRGKADLNFQGTWLRISEWCFDTGMCKTIHTIESHCIHTSN